MKATIEFGRAHQKPKFQQKVVVYVFQAKFGTNSRVKYETEKVETSLVEIVQNSFMGALKYLCAL